MLSTMKALVDGAISGLHVHDGTQLEVLSGRLGSRLGEDSTLIAVHYSTTPAPRSENAGCFGPLPATSSGTRRTTVSYDLT